MKLKHFIKNTEGQLDIDLAVTAVLGLILASAFLVIGVVVLQGVVDGGGLIGGAAGVGTYTASGAALNGQIITIGTETYTVSETLTGAFYLTNSSNASLAAAALVAEINANSTLVTAVDNSDNTVTITSVLTTAEGNYATTENMTNGAFGAAVMAGGITADTLYAAMSAVTSDIRSAMALAGTLILVIIGVAILMMLAGVMVIMRMFR
ncbi:MAG: hypothetical protein P1P69_04175 [Methanosarcinaceae archaeon]|nr:hypothetical protein [Methanosarcinaceae archaeon]